MFSFLKIIDNPRQDVPLISVLRSPLFGFTADSLARIRAASPKTDFYTALLLDEDQESKAFVRELTALRELAPEISVHRLLWHIYNRFHVLGIFGAMGGGEIRKDNLTALFEHVKKLENSGYSGLFALVTQLQRMIENGEVPDTNIRTASGGVRLMSIHKSKGLEFPVVILADLSKGFNDQDLRTPVLVHPALGVGAERVDLTRKIRYPTLARLAIERSLRSESRAEEMRILYVAMTRAKEKLIMVDSRRNGANVIKKLIPSAVCPVVPEAVCDGKCMGDWVLLPLLCRWEAKPLRDLAGMETLMHCTPGDTPWKVFIHDAAEYIKVTPRAKNEGQEEGAVTADLSVIGHMYPYARETRLPAKVTATQLKGREKDEEIATKDVDTSAAGANVVIVDDTVNNVKGSYVARIYKSYTLNEAGTEVVDSKKLHKYDGAFYSKMSLNMDGGDLNSGVLNINAENEGLDSELHLTINGGIININSGNDGINTNEDNISVTTMNDGILNIVVNGSTGEGDGIDSNGWLVINGGILTSSACGISMDAGIDSDMGIYINGGTVVASGNMLDRIAGNEQSYAVFMSRKALEGGVCYTVKDAEGKDVASYTPENDFMYMIVSASDMMEEGSYTLWSGDVQVAEGMTGMNGMGRPGMQDPGMRDPDSFGEGFGGFEGGFGGGRRPDDFEFPEGSFPEGMEPPRMPERMERPDSEKPGRKDA